MSDFRLFNTLTQKVEPFTPLHSKKISLYVCGVTPYDTSHLGHAFIFVFFDVLKRVFEYSGYEVTYVQNVTDIDDPLFERANQLGIPYQALVKKWIDYLLNDFQFLNIKMPDHYINASDELSTMQKITKRLVEKKFAYLQNGNVYFSVKSFPKYGMLSKFSYDEMLKLSAERGNDLADPNKQDPLDFPLWIKSEKGEPSWPSPWSKGRPGWHIECTAMSTKYLGEQIDIHGGGNDLIFPHHESEIAQAESYSEKKPFVQKWMHGGMVAMNGEKMSKSLGNLIYVQDLAKKYSANAVRFYLLSRHYRSDWEFSEKEMKSSAQKMAAIEKAIKDVQPASKIQQKYLKLLENDFNISKLLEELYNTHNIKQKKALFDLMGFYEKQNK